MKPLTPLKAAIIDAGFVHSIYELDLNCALADPSPRYPRSRMFKWPITVDRYEDRLTVCHPVLAFEPFVQRVVSTLKTPCYIEPNPPGCHGSWHHAVDLATDTDFRDLLKTRELVPVPAILRGVVIGVMHGPLGLANARTVLDEIAPGTEPDDRSVLKLSHGGLLRPAFIDTGISDGKAPTGKGRWVINLWSRRDNIGEAWAVIHGAEDGWFAREKKGRGYRVMTPAGMARHMGVPTP